MQGLSVWLPRQRDTIIAGAVFSLCLVGCGFPLAMNASELSYQEFCGCIMVMVGAALFCWASWSAMDQVHASTHGLTRYHMWLTFGTGFAVFMMLGYVSDDTWVSGAFLWLSIGAISAFEWTLRHWPD